MGRHGQALETLTEVLQAHNDPSLEEMDLAIFLSRCVKRYNADMVRYLILLYLEMQAKKCWS